MAHNLRVVGLDQATIWKTNYRYSMLLAEVLRLQAQYPERIAALNAG